MNETFSTFVAMSNVLNPDFTDFLEALNQADVRYILVGGYAEILHGYYRSTGDLDVWVEQTSENYHKLVLAFDMFGFPKGSIEEKDFLQNQEVDVFTFGRPPVSIDILTTVKGLDFGAAYRTSHVEQIQDTSVRFIDLDSLVTAKEIVGRYKDLDDIKHLTEEE